MQRLPERSAKGISRHDAASWSHLVHRLYYRTSCTDSSYPLIVMVESTQDRNSNYPAFYMMRGLRRSARFRKLLPNPLMRSCLVEVRHILIEHALELLLVEDEQVVEAFLPHTPCDDFRGYLVAANFSAFLASGVEIGSYVVVVYSRISDGVTKCASGILKSILDDREKSVIDDVSHLFHLLVDEEFHCCTLYYQWDMKKRLTKQVMNGVPI
jgi:hypothetical protein